MAAPGLAGRACACEDPRKICEEVRRVFPSAVSTHPGAPMTIRRTARRCQPARRVAHISTAVVLLGTPIRSVMR